MPKRSNAWLVAPEMIEQDATSGTVKAFGRRPPNTRRRPSSGRHPKPFTHSDFGERSSCACASANVRHEATASMKSVSLHEANVRSHLSHLKQSLMTRRFHVTFPTSS
jgi:hypothetical protein